MCVGSTCESPRDGELVAGDKVKVELEFELLKLMQEGHGGWNDFMVAVSVVWRTRFNSFRYNEMTLNISHNKRNEIDAIVCCMVKSDLVCRKYIPRVFSNNYQCSTTFITS